VSVYLSVGGGDFLAKLFFDNVFSGGPAVLVGSVWRLKSSGGAERQPPPSQIDQVMTLGAGGMTSSEVEMDIIFARVFKCRRWRFCWQNYFSTVSLAGDRQC